jgi:hypothetical protein
MSVQPSLNNSNMVVAEIINEINSTQPSGNMQSLRSTPIQRQQQQQQQQQQQPARQMPVQKRATPFRRPNSAQQPARQAQRPQQAQRQRPQQASPPPARQAQQVQRRPQKSAFLKNQEKMRNKKVRFREEVEERVIQNESDNDSESDSESEDTTPIEEIVLKSSKNKSKNKNTKKDTPKVEDVTTPKFLNKNEIQKNDLNETKGFYSKAIHFFTNDTKEPLVVLVLVFAISMPIVNKLMTRFLPFLMKHGEGSMFVVGAKALLVALVFFSVKKLLL